MAQYSMTALQTSSRNDAITKLGLESIPELTRVSNQSFLMVADCLDGEKDLVEIKVVVRKRSELTPEEAIEQAKAELAMKEQEKAEKEVKKQEKIRRDAEKRAELARLNEERKKQREEHKVQTEEKENA